MTDSVVVAGVGMTAFVKPSVADNYVQLGSRAIREAIADAGLDYKHIQQAYAGYVYGDSTSGQAVIYEVGLTGIPIINVNNNCSTGSTALYLARQAILSGEIDCALVVGFEQMARGALSEHWNDRPGPLQRFLDIANSIQGESDAPMAIRLFGGAGQEYKQRYGCSDETFAAIAVKARRHAKDNERAIFREPLTIEEVGHAPHMFGVLTRLQCCPPSCGGAAAVLCSETFARKHKLNSNISILAQAIATDTDTTFNSGSMMSLVGYDMSRNAATKVYEKAGIGPDDLDVVELHDCFTANELITYEALMLTPEGTAEQFIAKGDNTYGGQVVTNPSGGLLSKGHPLGATGLAQCAELVWQLRGAAGTRQVEGARTALAHNIGLGGACVVTLYQSN